MQYESHNSKNIWCFHKIPSPSDFLVPPYCMSATHQNPTRNTRVSCACIYIPRGISYNYVLQYFNNVT